MATRERTDVACGQNAGDQQCGTSDIVDGVGSGHRCRQRSLRALLGRHLESRHEHDGAQRHRHRNHHAGGLAGFHGHNLEATEERRRDVVRVTFELGGDLEQTMWVERPAEQLVRGDHGADPQDGACAQPASDREIALVLSLRGGLGAARDWPARWNIAQSPAESTAIAPYLLSGGSCGCSRSILERDVTEQAEGAMPKTVKAGTHVGACGRNRDPDRPDHRRPSRRGLPAARKGS